MDRWTEAEFRRVALNTRIGERTLDACKDVLVEGMSGVAAAEKHSMFPAQISRAITTLREKQAKLVEKVAVTQEADKLQKLIATEVAKALLGPNFECFTAKAGVSYEGPIITNTQGVLIQKIGPSGVLHDAALFKQQPPQNVPVRIAYDKDNSPRFELLNEGPHRGIER